MPRTLANGVGLTCFITNYLLYFVSVVYLGSWLLNGMDLPHGIQIQVSNLIHVYFSLQICSYFVILFLLKAFVSANLVIISIRCFRLSFFIFLYKIFYNIWFLRMRYLCVYFVHPNLIYFAKNRKKQCRPTK